MYSQKWFFSKMYPVSHRSMMGMSLNSYLGRLPKWGLMLNGVILPLKIRVLPISENAGSASYPSPTAMDSQPRKLAPNSTIIETSTGTFRALNPNGTQSNLGLARNVQINNYPSPVASDATQGAIIGKDDKFYMTKTGMPRKVNRNGKDGSVGLGRLVQMFPTPTATDAKNRGGAKDASVQRRVRIGKQVNLSMQTYNGNLSPEWTSLLMGYSTGWTDLNVDDASYSVEDHQFPAPRGVPQYDFEPPRVTDKKEFRRDRIKALGNAVVPQCILPIAQEMFKVLGEAADGNP